MALPASTVSQISNHLSKSLFLNPSPAWFNSFISSQKSTTPVTSLIATAKIRLLNADITTSLTASGATVFPADVHNAEIRERQLSGPIAVQVLGVEDISQSRWSQIEAIEASERGEGKKGREVIRVVPQKEGEDDLPGNKGDGGMCKLLLQDAKGTKVWAMEMKPVKGLRVGMSIGTKMILKQAVMARGVVLLSPDCVTILGGKLDNLHKAWAANRKAELKAATDSEATPAS